MLPTMSPSRRKSIDDLLRRNWSKEKIVDFIRSTRRVNFPHERLSELVMTMAEWDRQIDERIDVLTRGGDLLRCAVHGRLNLVDIRRAEAVSGERIYRFSIPKRGRGTKTHLVVDTTNFINGPYFHEIFDVENPNLAARCYALDKDAVDAALGTLTADANPSYTPPSANVRTEGDLR